MAKKLVKAQSAGFVPFPGMRPVNDPVVSAALQAAQRYWLNQGVAAAPSPTAVYTAESLSLDGRDPYGRGIGPAYGSPESEIALRSDVLGAWLAKARNPRSTRRAQRRAVRKLYGALAHEEGHVRGIKDHAATGPMQEQFTYGSAPEDWEALMHELRGEGLIPHGRARAKRRVRRVSRPSNYAQG